MLIVFILKIYASEDRKVMNSAEEFARTMFGNDFRSKVPIEKIENNSSFIGVFIIIIYLITNVLLVI